MKKLIKILSFFVLMIVVLSGCRKDNYDEPESFITGRVVYQGRPLQLNLNSATLL